MLTISSMKRLFGGDTAGGTATRDAFLKLLSWCEDETAASWAYRRGRKAKATDLTAVKQITSGVFGIQGSV